MKSNGWGAGDGREGIPLARARERRDRRRRSWRSIFKGGLVRIGEVYCVIILFYPVVCCERYMYGIGKEGM
jgi:hypothetical protein